MELVERIARLVSSASSGEGFEELALEAFAFQYVGNAIYRAMCDRTGRTPDSVRDWREVPMVPTSAFASLDLSTAPAREIFRSSGTGSGRRSVHRHPFPDLYRAVVEATFPPACLAPGDRPPMLSLIPSREVAPDSSLGFLVAHAIERFGDPDSTYGFGARGIEIGVCRSWLAARQRAGRPAVVLATAFALADLLDRLERMNLHFRMPPGSVVFETGGFKGRRREVSKPELLAQVERWLGIGSSRVVSEYGMTELTSHAYTRALAGGERDLFVTPDWLRVRVLEPTGLGELEPGRTGLLAFFDLANLGSAVHVLTQDLGRIEGDGFRLEGRAADADLRGCSLLAEELAG